MMQSFRTASSVLKTRSIKASANNLLKKFSSFSPQLNKARKADENSIEDVNANETEKQTPKMKTETANTYKTTSTIPVPILTPSIFNPVETVTMEQASKIRSKHVAQQYLQVLMSLQPGNPILYCEALLMLHKMEKFNPVENKLTGKEVTLRQMLDSALKMTPNFVSDMLLPKAKQLYDSTNYDDAGVLCEWIIELQKRDEFLEHSFSNQMSILEAAYIKCNILMKADEYDQAHTLNDEAIEFCGKMLPTSIADARRLHTAMADLFHMKGKLLVYFQKYTQALDALSMSLGLKPKNVSVIYERAYCLLYMGRKKESLDQLNNILFINPDHTEALYLKGMILREFEQYQESAIQFDKVARNFLKNRPMQSRHEHEDEEELYPSEFIDEFGYFDVWDPLRLSSSAFSADDSKFYIPTLNEVRSCPSIVYPLIERAISSIFVSSKDALDTLRPIIALKEKKFSMIVEASLYEQMKFADKKIQMRFANVALKLFPGNAKALYLKAQLFHSSKHYREAVELFEQVASIAHEIPGPHLFIASCYNYMNEFKKANEAADAELLYLRQKAEDEDPEFMLDSYPKHYSMACSLKAEILYSLGKKEDALKFTTKALEYDFDNITLIRQKANLLVELKLYNEALKFSEQLIRLDPAEGLRLKASIYFTLGRFGAALKFMDIAIEKNPTDIAGLIDKGVMLFDMKRYAEAYGCFNKVISLDPKASIAYQLRQKTLEFAPEALKRSLPAHEF